MAIQLNFVEYQDSRLGYVKTGNGPEFLLLFHGFGQDHSVFNAWTETLGDRFTLISFDLYFHGQSVWLAERLLEKSDWKKIMTLFLEHEQLHAFSIAGYSLGGKFALATLESFPEKIQKIFLLAPDGISTSVWYDLATYPIATRKLFKSMVSKPRRFQRLVKVLKPFGLINKSMLRFAETQMETEDKRRRVYFTWVYFRHIKFDLKKISSLLNRFRIPLTMIVGKYDKVVPTKNMIPLLMLVNIKKVEALETGHNDLIKKSAKLII